MAVLIFQENYIFCQFDIHNKGEKAYRFDCDQQKVARDAYDSDTTVCMDGNIYQNGLTAEGVTTLSRYSVLRKFSLVQILL